jgi:dihydrofolate synthase/folylpolyglutamate synthase
LIIGEQDHPAGFELMVAETGADALFAGKHFSHTDGNPFAASLIGIGGEDGQLEIDQLAQSSLLAINKTVALQALLAAGIEVEVANSRKALQQVGLRGRQQRLNFRGVEVILDVAHNPAAATKLAERLAAQQGTSVAVASVLDDKDWSGILDAMSLVISHWHIAEISQSSRASKGQYLLDLLYNADQSGDLHRSIEEAFLQAVDAVSVDTETQRIVVFGSFHMVALVLNLILAEVGVE